MDISKGFYCCSFFYAFVALTSIQSANAAIYQCHVEGKLVLQDTAISIPIKFDLAAAKYNT